MAGYHTLRTKLRRDIRHQWPQFVAVTLTMLLGVMLFAASYDAYRNLRASYEQVFADEHFADLFVTGGDTQAYAAQAAGADGVAATATRTQADVPVQVSGDKLRGRVVGYPGQGEPAVNRLTILEGSGLSGPDTALVEHHMAEHFGLNPGSKVTVVGPDGPRTLSVTGTVSSGEYLWPARSRQEPITTSDDFGVLFVPEVTAESLAGLHAPNQVLVRLTAGARTSGAVLDQLASAAGAAGATEVLTRAEQPSNSVLQEDIDGFKQMAEAFPLLFLSAAALATYVLLTRRVQAERPVIGMLRAAGARRRTIAGHYLAYGVTAGIVAAILGVALGTVAAGVLSRLYIRVIDLPERSAVIAVGRPLTLLGGLAFGLLVGALAALAPALQAARIAPAEAMRGEVPTEPGRRTLLERLLPPLQRAPARWRMVLRGIARHRRRTAFTATGVALALLLVLSSWTLIDTMNALLHRQFDEITRQDAQADFAGPVGRQQLDALQGVAGVTLVESLVTMPVALVHDGKTYGTTLYGYQPDTSMHGFRLAGGGTTGLPEDGVLLGQAVTDRIGVRTGDEVTIRVAGSGQEVRARVAGLLDEPLGTFAYASQPWLGQVVGDVPANSALLSYAPGTDPGAVRHAVTDLAGVVAYTDSAALARTWDSYTGLFYGFVGGMLVLGGLMAFAIIFTTMSVNIVERRRELAMLRAAGVKRRALSELVTAENLLVTVLGVIPGLVLGVVGGAALLQSYSSDQFRLELVVRPVTLVVAATAILAVAWISQWPGLRSLGRMDLAAVVRERAS